MNHEPKILSIGTSVPVSFWTQDQVWEALRYGKSHLKRIFDNSQIDRRYLWIPLHKANGMSWQEMTEEYDRGARLLSQWSIMDCLHNRPIPKDLGSVTYVSCTGSFGSPSVAFHCGYTFPKDTHFTHIGASGCGGGFPGLDQATNYVKAYQRPALVVSTELCSCTFFPENGKPDSHNDFEVLRANSLFADASAAVLIGYDDDWRHPTIIDSEHYYDMAYLNDLGFVWQDGRLRVLLSRRVKDVAAEVAAIAVKNLLKRRHLTLREIKWFVIHAAGAVVLDNIRDQLGMPEEGMRLSREILKTNGNCSSATIGLIGKRLMKEDIKQGDYALVVGVGPGMIAGAVILGFV